MGKIDLSVNPVHVRFRNKQTGKRRWMRCREYALLDGRVSVTIIKKGHQLTEWFSLSEWEIERTDAPEGTPAVAITEHVAPETSAPVLAFTPRGSENPNAPKSAAEAIARRDDTRKIGDLKRDVPGEYNAWAHLDRTNPMGDITAGDDEEKKALARISLQASIAAEATKQEAMRKLRLAQHKRQLMGRLEVSGIGFEPS
jgi:hypothetical protein